MADAVIVGGGVAGLCAAIRLRVLGHHVVLLERSGTLGGKLDERVRDGFVFDTGPSLLTLPHVFDEVLRLAGTSLAAAVDLHRLDPQFRYRFSDASELTVADDHDATAVAFDRLAPGAGAAWARLVERGGRIWDVSERTFLAGPMGSPLALARRLRSPRDLLTIDGARTLRAAARADFTDARLQQWLGRYATYSGSDPGRAPATLACIPAIESRYGAWYVGGGLGRLRDALVAAARHVGAELHTDTGVVAVDADRDRVRGVRLAGGERLAADVVVANVDAEHLYADLLPEPVALARVRRVGRSSSGFVLLVAAEGTTPGLAHHHVWFAADPDREFRQIFTERRMPDDPTIYACTSVVTDTTQAPAGTENWFLLVNAPSDPPAVRDADLYADHVLAVLARRGVDLRRRTIFREIVTPAALAHRYRSPGGAIYGTSSNGRRAAFLRPGNRGPRRGLYLAGGSSHPGGGLPLVATSARIVADLVREDGW